MLLFGGYHEEKACLEATGCFLLEYKGYALQPSTFYGSLFVCRLSFVLSAM